MTTTDTGPQTEAQKVVRSWLRLWVPADQHADALRDLDIALAEARRLTVERVKDILLRQGYRQLVALVDALAQEETRA